MIGIDISDRSVKVVRLSNRADHKLLTHCWQEVPLNVIEKGVIKDTKVMQEVLRHALQRCNLSWDSKDAVVASIPETQSFLRVIEIPLMDESEIGEAIQWEVAQHIPFGLENVYIDWQPIHSGKPPTPGRHEVLVGAAEKSVVDPLLHVLATIGLDIAAFELESQAIVRSLVSRELEQHRGLLIVDLGGSATNVVIYDRGTIRFTASLQKGSYSLLHPLTPTEAQAVTGPPKEIVEADRAMLASKLQAVHEELVIEIQGIVEFYNGIDTNHQVKEIILTGGGANLPGFDQAVLKYFDNVLVHRGNPWVNILPPGKDAHPPFGLLEAVHFSTALGLALRAAVK
ncbi:MAG: type IV pilus assembly protein PilM [Candidatus Andersenbacteria bacterium]